jgi:hypothetical protein
MWKLACPVLKCSSGKQREVSGGIGNLRRGSNRIPSECKLYGYIVLTRFILLKMRAKNLLDIIGVSVKVP